MRYLEAQEHDVFSTFTEAEEKRRTGTQNELQVVEAYEVT
jgi:hypothetical protein